MMRGERYDRAQKRLEKKKKEVISKGGEEKVWNTTGLSL